MRGGCVCLYPLLWRPGSAESHLPNSSAPSHRSCDAQPPLQEQHPKMRALSVGPVPGRCFRLTADPSEHMSHGGSGGRSGGGSGSTETAPRHSC